jgi:predicted nucleotidyltransferase
MELSCDKIQYYKIGNKEKASIIAKLKKTLAEERHVKQAWIFGSFTRGESVRDLDIAIHAEPQFSFKDFLFFNAEIELSVGIPVDLVEIEEAPASLRENIVKNGVVIK